MAGGWHGFNTELNKGVHKPFDRAESAGILEEEQAHVRNVRFNDLEAAEAEVKHNGGDTAAIFLEPVLGAGGCVPAERDYLKGLRELADRTGVLLAFDEIITGYRLALGGAQEWYGVKPDLAALGKTAGGGMPLGLVCGRKEIIALADPTNKSRFVSIGGGTFSENPMTMTAGLATVRYLRRNAGRIYPMLGRTGAELRRRIDRELGEQKVEAHTTGLGSLFLTHFGPEPRSAEDASAEERRPKVGYALHLMSRGIFVLPGHPCGISTCHTEKDMARLVRVSGEYGAILGRK